MKIQEITKKATNHFDKHTLILWNKITTLAQEDKEYNKQLDIWLNREKSTVHLRDELALRFRDDAELEGYLVFKNAWMSLDSISNELYREEKIELVNDMYIVEISRGDYHDEVLIPSVENEIESVSVIGNTKYPLKAIDKKMYLEDDTELKYPFVVVSDEVRSDIKERIADYLMDNEDSESLELFLESVDKEKVKDYISEYYDGEKDISIGTTNAIKDGICEYFDSYRDSELVYEYEKYLVERLIA